MRKNYESRRRIESRHQLVATGFRHQDFRIGRILLDLWLQPLDMGFRRVRGDARLVPQTSCSSVSRDTGNWPARYRKRRIAVSFSVSRTFLALAPVSILEPGRKL